MMKPNGNVESEELGAKQTEDKLQAAIERCHMVKFSVWKLRVELNPVVTVLSSVVIWGLVIWCMVEPQEAEATLAPWTIWITKTFTWLYIGTSDIWILLILVIFFSKYSKLKLGKDSEVPEFSDLSYFTMLFAGGIGIGLFYFGVAEPVMHYEPDGGNRYQGRYSDNQRAQDAINLTFYHWGLHSWIVYVIVGLTMAFVSYRMDLPMTIRSCFYPILGDRIYGNMGDVIDIVSVVATMFGVCTSLGLGVMQLNAGFHRLNSDIPVNTTTQIITIWCITAVATASVISGLKVGIRRLSEICFGLGMFIMLVIFFADDTWYYLNVYVQSIGYYLQNVVQLGFHTDAFAQLGNAPDGMQNPDWMNTWTIFYWGWWTSWSPFVGMFIAKISRGRTVGEFIQFTLTIPILYAFLWMSIFGGAGLKMERDAALANITCSSPLGGANSSQSYNGLYRLSCRNSDDQWFDVVGSYEGIGDFLSIASLAGIILYFVTSSDSGSLIIDTLSANGHQDPPVLQRIFWALTEGACATALLQAGGEDALNALQTVSVAAGLPFSILLCFMCVSLWRALKSETGELRLHGDVPKFYVSLLDMIDNMQIFLKFLFAIPAPWYFLAKVQVKFNSKNFIIQSVIMAVLLYSAVILLILELVVTNLAYVGLTLYFAFVCYCSSIRTEIRQRHGINGNMVEDFFASLFMFPCVAVQLYEHVNNVDDNKNDDAAASAPVAGSQYKNFSKGKVYPIKETKQVFTIENEDL